jgi:hypothetical protein
MDVDGGPEAINDCQHLARALREAETNWEQSATLLVIILYEKTSELDIHLDDKASELGMDLDDKASELDMYMDLDDVYQTKDELTMAIEAPNAENKVQRTTALQDQRAVLSRLYVLESKLAALRDLRYALGWVRADDRPVHASPTSGELRGIGGRGSETITVDSTLEVAAMVVKLSDKICLLEDETRKVNDAAATLEEMDWQPDEAPLTVMRRFS